MYLTLKVVFLLFFTFVPNKVLPVLKESLHIEYQILSINSNISIKKINAPRRENLISAYETNVRI